MPPIAATDAPPVSMPTIAARSAPGAASAGEDARGTGWREARLLRWSRHARRLAGHRLVQFAVIGGGMFLLAPAAERRDLIAVQRHTLDALAEADSATRGRGTAADRAARGREVAQRFIEDEILYREGLRLGLDTDDGIVRQRVVQKVLFMAEELGGASRPPAEEELRAFHAAHPERFQRPAHLRFRQIYARERGALPAAPDRAWAAGGTAAPVAREVDVDAPQLDALLGDGFAARLAGLAPGRWSGPVPSAYGWHLVQVVASAAPRPATFEEARVDVAAQFVVARRQDAIARYLSTAFAKYRVEIDGRPLRGLTPSRRLAIRSVASPED